MCLDRTVPAPGTSRAVPSSRLLLLVPAVTFAALACARRAGPTPGAAPAAPAPLPIVDESALDRATDPCQDFYRFSCGGWLARTPIPPDRPAWSRSFSEINERN